MLKLTVDNALQRLAGDDFVRLFERDAFDIGLYKPDKTDAQDPHKRDELYVVASGDGDFWCDGETTPVKRGDVLFVAAGTPHRFERFTADFSTWVVFFGPRPDQA